MGPTSARQQAYGPRKRRSNGTALEEIGKGGRGVDHGLSGFRNVRGTPRSGEGRQILDGLRE